MESNGKILAIIVHRIVDSNTASIKSCKSQYKRERGKIKRAKDVRKEIFQELEKEIRESKVADVMVVGYF